MTQPKNKHPEYFMGNIKAINIGTDDDPFYIPEMTEDFKEWMRNNMIVRFKRFKKDDTTKD